MNNMQAVVMPYVIFGDISFCSEEYHSDYFIAAPSCDYDSQNRLVRYNDSALNVTYVYTYDNRGNILNYRYMDYVPKGTAVSETGGDTYTYSYTNNVLKDAVTDINGEAITYDSSYNPLTWTYGRTFTWVQGRRLETVTDGSTVTTYTYDENGIRVAKNISSGGRSTQYYVADGTYLGEKTTYRGVTFLITYLYGDSGIVGIEVNGTKYFFVKNLQGDVTGIIDSTGAVIANYAYDSYGFCYSVTDASGNNITSATHIANLNPFRYRSYMYDTETGFYYLTTRYYDPDVGRFINLDDPDVLDLPYYNAQQFNLFAYCNDNPVDDLDDTGDLSWGAKLAIGTAVIAAAAILTVATAGTGTALACFAVGALKGAAVGAAIGAASGAATGAVGHRVKTGSWKGSGKAALEGAADGYMSGAITGFVSGGLSSSACFVAGTSVATATGKVAIEEIKSGDLVYATDPETGETELKQVVQTFENQTTELVHLNVNGEEIITTPTHPFWVPQKGWTSAINLRAGDMLQLLNGEYVVLEAVQHELLESPITVYNFEVEDFHTYYVTDSEILVHNMCMRATNHGGLRIGQRGLSQKEYNLLKASKNVKRQADGAKVYIRAINSNKHNIIIENEAGEIITFLKDITKHELKNLARNYGWF